MSFTADEVRVLKALASGILNSGGGGSGRASNSGISVASDRELDGQWGNPSVRKDPKRWAGDSCVGLKYSECPSEFLVCLAEFLEWKVAQDKGKPDAKRHAKGKFYWEFDQKDAALARGWARRVKADEDAGRFRPKSTRAEPEEDTGGGGSESFDYATGGEDEIPFAVNMTFSRSGRV